MWPWPIALAVGLWTHADASDAARLTALRVGTHPGYTRVVLETDAPAAYQVLEASADTPGEITVQIAAEARARDVTPQEPGSPRVALLPQPDGTTLVRIRASGPLRVETQVLAMPPRLVLDLRSTVREVAATVPAPALVREAAPTPPPEVVASPSPTPEPTPAPAPDVALLEAPPAIRTPAAIQTPAPIDALAPIDEPPPVASPPDLDIDPLSIVVGLAAGFLLALAARRRREIAVVAPGNNAPIATPESVAMEPIETTEESAAPEPDALAEPLRLPESRDAWRLDVVRMHQRLDARLAEIADQLGELAQRQSRLEARGGAQNEELASQRAAIARLQRSLRPASPPPQTPPGPLRPDPTSAFGPMRKRIGSAGAAREGLELLPPLETNPSVEACALIADAPGIQILPPPLARTLYAFGPADAMSKPDPLRSLRERLDTELARSRTRGHSLVLALLRVDGLEALRDLTDADAAERAALALAQALRRALRDFDVVARPEPDLFAAIVPDPAGDVPPLLVAIYRATREALDAQGDPARGIEVRIGYAVFPEDGDDADALDRAARARRVEAL